MKHKNPSSGSTQKFDASMLWRFVLGYEDYWRLMALLFVLGLLAGTTYYVFARATFISTAVVRVNRFVDPTRVAQESSEAYYLTMRTLIYELTSPYQILEAGKKMGIASEKNTYRDLRDNFVPKVRASMLDQDLLEVTVEAFKPEIVREFPLALVESYHTTRARLLAEHREKAVGRYLEEMAAVRKRVGEQLDERLKFEEESALASAQVELESLSDIPVRLVRVKYRLQEMDRLREIMKEQGQNLGTVEKLALLDGRNDGIKDPLSSGRLVRTPSPSGSSPVQFENSETRKTVAQVVVQPEMVEGLKPWHDIEKRKRAVEEKIRLTRFKFLDDHPEMVKLKEELREVTAALELEQQVAEKAFDVEYNQLVEQKDELEKKLPEYYKATKTYDEKRLDYELIQKGQLAWDKAYEKLAKQIEGFDFAPNTAPNSLEFQGFVEMRSEVPISPSKSKLAMLGVLLGLGLAGGVPFLLRRLDSTVSDLSEFEESLGIPGIGLVPRTDPKLLEEINRSPSIGATVPNALLENFRLIRSSILLNPSPKGDAHVIMVTSARPGEGKTTVSCNIAWAFASLGEKTIVVDCDLRRGRVAAVAAVDNSRGVTDILCDSAKLDGCIQKSSAANLWVLPRGPTLAGTTELLNAPVFNEVLEKLKTKFDRIILDTPPVLGLSETAFLQNHAAGVVLVVRANRTPRKDAVDAFETLQKLGGHFYGFVLNAVDFSKRSNMYQYYYYSSNYYEDNWAAS